MSVGSLAILKYAERKSGIDIPRDLPDRDIDGNAFGSAEDGSFSWVVGYRHAHLTWTDWTGHDPLKVYLRWDRRDVKWFSEARDDETQMLEVVAELLRAMGGTMTRMGVTA